MIVMPTTFRTGLPDSLAAYLKNIETKHIPFSNHACCCNASYAVLVLHSLESHYPDSMDLRNHIHGDNDGNEDNQLHGLRLPAELLDYHGYSLLHNALYLVGLLKSAEDTDMK